MVQGLLHVPLGEVAIYQCLWWSSNDINDGSWVKTFIAKPVVLGEHCTFQAQSMFPRKSTKKHYNLPKQDKTSNGLEPTHPPTKNDWKSWKEWCFCVFLNFIFLFFQVFGWLSSKHAIACFAYSMPIAIVWVLCYLYHETNYSSLYEWVDFLWSIDVKQANFLIAFWS